MSTDDDMPILPFPARRRRAELYCVLFGHSWHSYGCTRAADGAMLEEYSTCERCGLENHDRSGYLALYNRSNGRH